MRAMSSDIARIRCAGSVPALTALEAINRNKRLVSGPALLLMMLLSRKQREGDHVRNILAP